MEARQRARPAGTGMASEAEQPKGRETRRRQGGASIEEVTGNRTDPRVGSGMQQARSLGAGASCRGREKRRGRNARGHWHGIAEGKEAGNRGAAGSGLHQGRRRRGELWNPKRGRQPNEAQLKVDQRLKASDERMSARAGDCIPATARETGAVRKHMRGHRRRRKRAKGPATASEAQWRRRRERPRGSSLGRPKTKTISPQSPGNRGRRTSESKEVPRWEDRGGLVVKAKRAPTRAPTSRSSELTRLRPARPLTDRNVMGGSFEIGESQLKAESSSRKPL